MTEIEKWRESLTQPRQRLVRYSPGKNAIEFDTGNGWDGFVYNLDATAFLKRDGLIRWFNHLSEKTWFSIEHARELFLLLENNDFPIPT
jgi:hypothetical protein